MGTVPQGRGSWYYSLAAAAGVAMGVGFCPAGADVINDIIAAVIVIVIISKEIIHHGIARFLFYIARFLFGRIGLAGRYHANGSSGSIAYVTAYVTAYATAYVAAYVTAYVINDVAVIVVVVAEKATHYIVLRRFEILRLFFWKARSWLGFLRVVICC